MSNFKFKNLLDALKYLKNNKETIQTTEKVEVEGLDADVYYDDVTSTFSLCFEDEVEDDIVNNIFHNSINFAKKIYNALQNKDIVIAMAPMQYGKTSTIDYLSNALLAKDYNQGETTLFLTSMSDTALFIQNKTCLEDKKFFKNGKWHKSVTYVAKMVPDFKNNPFYYINKLNVKVIVFDECDYGSSEKSVFNQKLFKDIKSKELDVKIVLISATPYCAINAVLTGELDAEIVTAEKPNNYFGVKKMLEYGIVTDIKNYNKATNVKERKHYRLMSPITHSLTNEFMTDLDWFIDKEKGGLCLIRAENRKKAKTLKQLVEEYSDEYEVIVVGVRFDSIKTVLGSDIFALEHSILYENKKIVLIVINALSAGKDLGDLKKHVRLVIETRSKMVANGSQGLVGRICGYHNNTDIRIIASLDILEAYSRLEDDYTILQDTEFINTAVDLGLDFSTQLKKATKSRLTMKYETDINGPFTFDEILNYSPNVTNLFENPSYGEYDEIIRIIKDNKRTKSLSAINTQRSEKYLNHPEIFENIWNECVNGTITFANRFHRFRAEVNDLRRLRIKRGLIINDKTKKLYIIDRINDGEEVYKDAEVKNTSCYICQ